MSIDAVETALAKQLVDMEAPVLTTSPVIPPSKTLLDDVVEANNPLPKKRQRNIPNDALVAIQPANGDWSDNLHSHRLTRSPSAVDEASTSALPSTQLPPPSRFASTRQTLLEDVSSDNETGWPPSTQQLPPSKFGVKRTASKKISLTGFAADPNPSHASERIVSIHAPQHAVLTHLNLG